jgi:hypothetical protein
MFQLYGDVMTDQVREALRQIQQQIAEKTKKRAQLDVEIAQLQATKIGLQNALGEHVRAEIAWTNLVLAALNKYPGRPMTAVEIRDELTSWGYNFAGIHNPLAFINTCVQRLAEQGKVIRSDRGRPFRFSCQ